MSFFAELRRRNVIRMAALLACLVGAAAVPLGAAASECPDLSTLQPTPLQDSPRTPDQLEAERIVAQARAEIAAGVSDVVLTKAIAGYEEALRIDPGSAPAHLHLARAHLQSQRYLSVPVELAHARAFDHLAKGRAIDPGNITGLHVLADEAFLRTLDYGCVRRVLETALRLAPDDALTHRMLAELLSGMGEFALAFEHSDRAVALSEGVALRNMLHNQGRPRFMAGQYDWVLDHYATYLAANPGGWLAHFYRSLAFGAKGDVEQALVEAKLAMPLAPAGDAGGIAMLAMAYAKAGREKEARAMLGELLGRRARGEHVVEYRIAAVFEALGERDAAFDWLDREIADRDGYGSWLLWLNQDPAWNDLRTDPRFKDIQRRSGW